MKWSELLGYFISFGDNAEFGMLQQSLGIRPIGLLSLGGSDCLIEGLIRALNDNFSSCFRDDGVKVVAGQDHWVVTCDAYAWSMFSRYPRTASEQDVLRAEWLSFSTSAAETINQLRRGDKIFLIKHNESYPIEAYRQLVQAVRRYSNMTVLCVGPADDEHPHALVEVVERGFLRGYMDKLAPYSDASMASKHSWIDLCASAIEIVRRDKFSSIDPVLFNARLPLRSDALLSHFISFGDNCEFGLVQRDVGLEVLDLLRFGGVGPGRLFPLMMALIENFEGFKDPKRSMIFPHHDEWFYGAYEMSFHTYRPTSMPAEKVEQDEKMKMRFLANKTIEDLQEGRRIFVVKTNETQDPLAYTVVFRLMRKYGPASLLWVSEADSAHAPGSVEILEDGFFRGYIERFAPYENAHDFLTDAWLELCQNVLDLWQQGRPVASMSGAFLDG